jgi:hypothetical protein
MSWQEPIYNQNGNPSYNETNNSVNLSSDICIFSLPMFTMSGASKIACDIQVCDLSGVSYNNILTATTECFTSNGLSGTCFNSISWNTKITEDDVLVYDETFYTSSNLTDVATQVDFSGSVVTAFDSLGYIYSFSGTQFSIEQRGFDDIRLDIETTLNYDANCPVTGATTGETLCSCPAGYTASTGNADCYTIETSGITSATTLNAVAGDNNAAYAEFGTVFYENIDSFTYPLRFTGSTNQYGAYSGTNFMVDATGQVVTGVVGGPGAPYGPTPFTGTTLWGENTLVSGRLNNAGLKSSPSVFNEWLGFSYCVDLPYTGVYSIGLAADDNWRVKINGEFIFNTPGVATLPPYPPYGIGFQSFHVFPITLNSGKNIIEMEYYDTGGNAAMVAEIYTATTEVLTGITSGAALAAETIFTTADYIGQTFHTGENYAYSCASGYSVDLCITGSPVCTKIVRQDIECVFTGTCSGTSEVVCDLQFSGLTVDDANVHCISGETTIPLDFTFTANTSEFVDTDAQFYFEIFKYNHTFKYFEQPSVYKSDVFEWSSFSGTSAFTTNIPVGNLNIDGDYLVKGYYLHNICTEFGLLDEDKMVSPSYNNGDEFRIYQKYKDFHFLAFSKAEEPEFTTSAFGGQPLGALLANSYIFTTDGEPPPALPPTQTGKYIISLNGLTLAEDIDYSLTPRPTAQGTAYLLNLSGNTYSGDVLTYAYTNSTDSSNIRIEGFEITTAIVSGATNGQGSEVVYYNTDTSKYELYMELEPGNVDVIVTVNGVTLANNIDYYLSITDTNRIILEGDLYVGDVINIIYNPVASVQGNVNDTTLTIGWTINTAPQLVNGTFTVEFSSDENFTTLLPTSATTDYIIGQVGYNAIIPISGTAGDTQYYRVKNEKEYEDLCGNKITTTAYSEVVDIIIQTNAFNTY